MNDYKVADNSHSNSRDNERGSSSDSGTATGVAREMRPIKKTAYSDDPTNLIVNYLPVYFTEDHLRELFSQYGHIESLIVMYNKQAYRKKSKGYGFVKFSNGEEAAAAIKGVDGTRVANKTIKVSIARPGRARHCSNVFVSRLPCNWRDEDLQAAFSEFGHIVECRVLTFGDGVSRRCGFVRYDSDEEAKLAMNKMKNYRPTPRDAPLQVNLSVNHSPDARQMSLEKEMAMHGGRDPFNDYFPPWMSRSELYNTAMHRIGREDDFMMGYGGMGGMYEPMMHDPLASMPFGGRGMPPPPRDMGFYADDYGSAYGGDYGPPPRSHMGNVGGDYGPPPRSQMGNLNFQPVRNMKKDYGWNRGADSKYGGAPKNNANTGHSGTKQAVAGAESARLFVQNLPEFYEESQLKQLFSSYAREGEITEVTVQRDRNGKSIQCGFVMFTASSDANRALESLDGVTLSTLTLMIHVM